MKKAVFCMLVLVIFCAATSIQASGHVGSQTATPGAVTYVEGFNVEGSVYTGRYYTREWYGIRYTPTVSYNLKKVELMAGRGNGPFIVQLRLDNGTGWPSSVVLRQVSFPLVDTVSWQGAEFPSSYYVTAGLTYWIVFRPVQVSQMSIAQYGTPITYVYDYHADGWDYRGMDEWMAKFYREIPKVDTVLDFSFTPNPAAPGDTVTLSGTLKTVGGSPVYPAQVRVEYSPDGGTTWHYIWTLNTNASGAFSQSFAAPTVGEYLVRVSYAGSTIYNPSSDTETLIVSGLTESWIYFIFTPNPASTGQTVTLKGILVDDSSNPIGSAALTVRYSTDHGTTWHSALTLTTNQYGIFSQTFTAPSTGTYLVQVSYAGSPTYKPSSSNAYLVVQ